MKNLVKNHSLIEEKKGQLLQNNVMIIAAQIRIQTRSLSDPISYASCLVGYAIHSGFESHATQNTPIILRCLNVFMKWKISYELL